MKKYTFVSPSDGICIRAGACTYANADKDHLDVAEHLRDADEDVQQNGHKLRKTGHPRVNPTQTHIRDLSSPASGKKVKNRLLQVIVHQPTYEWEKEGVSAAQ